MVAPPEGQLSLRISDAEEGAKRRRFKLAQWVVVLNEPGDGRQPKTLYIKVSKGVRDVLRHLYSGACQPTKSTLARLKRG